jgi:type IV secretion system protein VirB3
MQFERRSTIIHSSLLEVKSAGGAEFMPVVANVTIAFVMMIAPHFLWWPVVSWCIHKLLQYLFKVDERMFAVLFRYLNEGDYYDPWPRPGMRNKRPYGMGRDLPLC